MIWLLSAFLSATLLGFYDVFKKNALLKNAVIPVLFLNTLISSLIFLPFILFSYYTHIFDDTIFFVPTGGWGVHRYIFLKSLIVLSSWVFGYFAMKHLPITIVGPVNATRPVMVLLGALLFYNEHLNMYQWLGIALSIFSFFLMSRSGKKEGIVFYNNRWIIYLILAAVLGAISGLYDKFLMANNSEGGIGLHRMIVQSWYNIYQCIMMGIILLLSWWPTHHQTTPFRWRWSIPFISLFLCAADFVYFYSLSQEGALLSVVSMIRRGSVVVSFMCGFLFFHEKNAREKSVDLLLVLLGMLLLYFGSR